MLTKQNLIVVLLLCLLACNVIGYLRLSSQMPKTGYVNIHELFNQFDMKKDMINIFESEILSEKNYLDSLSLILEKQYYQIQQTEKSDKKELMKFLEMRENYYKRVDNFENRKQEKINNYDAQIINQMNQYISQYGKENNYTYIYGNDGNGSMLYVNKDYDITEDILSYINTKYAGKNE